MLAPFNPYQQTQVSTASPENILIMLYDGAVNNSRKALERLNNRDVAGKGLYIGKALAIVAELMNTLNHDVGGEISQRLEQLYLYVMDEFTRANIEGRAQSLEDAIKVLLILRDAWTEAIEIQKNERLSSPTEVGKMIAAGGARG